MKYQFGEFELDVRAYELRRRGQPVRLARQPMDLLLMLLDRPCELVTREHIAQHLWPRDIHTDVDAGIHTAILKIRQVLGDSREAPRFVETVPGKGYRFVTPLLTGGTRMAVARQRTLEATVEWSYQLLSLSERELLCRLAVFPAAWTLDAAEHICSVDGVEALDILDLLTRLVDKSLVIAETTLGERRYRLLETIRQYARARLAEAGGSARLSERHFEFFFNEFRDVFRLTRHHEQLHCSDGCK